MPHSYGWIPDKQDERDFLYKAVQRIDQLPPSVDMRQFCSPVRDQGKLGSCTGFSIASGLREFIELKNAPVPPIPPGDGVPSCLETIIPKSWFKFGTPEVFTELSPLFLYYQERLMEGTVEYDSGAEMRDGMKVLNTIGVSSERLWPYTKDFTDKPSLAAMLEAGSFKASAYSRVVGLINIKSCLAVGGGLALGFNVYESFETDDMAQTGRMPMPKKTEQLLGGHAVFCCGYVDDPDWAGGGYLIIKNSWGADWADHGFFYMPYEYAASEEVIDVWTASV